MPPPLELGNDVLDRTIRSIEQAQGRPRHHTTADDILQAQASDESELVSLSSTGIAGRALTANVDDNVASISPLQIEINTPINLISNLAASTTLLQNLRVRNSILVADLARATFSLQQHESRVTKLLSEEHRSRSRWMSAAVCSFTIWMMYLWWCWYMCVEFEYIRRRRGEVFGL